MKKIGSLIFVLLFTIILRAEISVQADLDRKDVEMGDTFLLTITVSSSEGSVDVKPPDFPNLSNLKVVGQSQSSSTSMSIIQGKITSQRNLKYNYQIQALKKGNIAIPSITVAVEDKVLKTESLRVNVVDPGTIPNIAKNQQSNDPFADVFNDDDPFERLLREKTRNFRRGQMAPPVNINPNEAFSVRAFADKASVYVGEQVTANYYIYVPEQYQLRSIDPVKYPNLKGFWKEDIEIATNLKWEREVINGVSYMKALLASYALFPIKAGKVNIDEYKTKCGVSRAGIYGFGKSYEYTKSSKAIAIEVKELPKEGQPNSFTGAVGNFAISAKIDSKQVKQHQPFPLIVKLEGNGNAKNIDLPTIDLPPHLELYDTKEETQFFKTGKSFKEFTIYLIPRESGNVEIPAIPFSFFDPSSGQYIEKNSKQFSVAVVEGNPQDIQVADSQLNLKNNIAKVEDVKEWSPQLILNLESKAAIPILTQIYILLGLLFVSFVYIFLSAKKYLFKGNKSHLKDSLENRIKILKEHMRKGDYRAFGAEATNTINNTFSAVMPEIGSGVEMQEIVKSLPPSLRKAIGEDLIQTMKEVQAMTFAPEATLGDLKTKERMKKNINMVSKTLNTLIASNEI